MLTCYKLPYHSQVWKLIWSYFEQMHMGECGLVTGLLVARYVCGRAKDERNSWNIFMVFDLLLHREKHCFTFTLDLWSGVLKRKMWVYTKPCDIRIISVLRNVLRLSDGLAHDHIFCKCSISTWDKCVLIVACKTMQIVAYKIWLLVHEYWLYFLNFQILILFTPCLINSWKVCVEIHSLYFFMFYHSLS